MTLDDPIEFRAKDEQDGGRCRQLSSKEAEEVFHVGPRVGKDEQVDEDHEQIDQGNVVDGPGDVLGLVEEGFRIANVVTDSDPPEEEEELSKNYRVVPPSI